MASFTAANGTQLSAATITDPKALKKHLANGKKSTSSTNATMAGQAASSTFDPRRLLDPKGFNNNQRQRESESASTESTLGKPSPSTLQLSGKSSKTNGNPPETNGNGLPKQDHENYDGLGIGSLIEKVHNVSQREERPRKKPRVENGEFDVEEDKKVSFFGGGKGGEIGDYLKEKKKQGIAESGPVNAVVDLTGDDEEEEIVVVSDSQEKEVCYGRLQRTKVSAHQLPCPSGKAVYMSKGDWPAMRLQLKRFPGKDNIIRVIDPMGKDFGNVDVKTSSALARIMDSKNPRFRTQARIPIRKRQPNDYAGKECSEYFDITINLYGPKVKAQSLGRFLKQRNVLLGPPFMVDNGIEVVNPHQPADTPPRTPFGGTQGTPRVAPGYVVRTAEEIHNDIVGMFDSLEQSDNLPEIEADPRVTTPLLSHQKQGLYFLTTKEEQRVFSDNDEDNNSLWRLKYRSNGSPTYYNVITGTEERNKPPEVLGGILADMMGLGKTLTILSLIVGSLEVAIEWEETGHLPEMDGDRVLIRNSKTTLLVSPLSTLANWEDQIATHIKPGALKYYVYHGANRITDINALAHYDLVITTYSIVASEYGGRAKRKDIEPLLQTNFFRIVLDEAHMIREQSTRQSQAICALSAQRRWAVTGTPVQNRLDDLGALIKFLRVHPFDKGGFSQFILAPFKNADPEIIPKLRLLVDSITLRRLKDRIDLPGRHDHVVRLPFTDEEFGLYDWFAKDSQNTLKVIAGEQKKSLGGKTYAHILRAIMRLRLLCAHGRELLSEDDLKVTEGFSLDNAITLDDEEDDNRPALSPKQAYEMLMLFRETDSDTCVQCTRKIVVKDREDTPNGSDDVLGCMLPCYQIICRQCMDAVKSSITQISSRDRRFKCPFCEQTLRTSFFELTKDGIEAAEEAKALARENPRNAKIMGRYGGPHTKVKALLEELRKSEVESQSLPADEHPIKSVVFSGWTANLDLIQIALEDNNVKFVRLDGKMSRKNRNQSLDAFRDDPTVCVILISIMAGGLGLNLTTGSKVYVMEPQFNPAAEAQAVDRVHRLGQRREVFTYRFIMKDSFEEKMLDLQRKKQNLADLSMNRGKIDKAEAAKRKLDELRSLFR